MSKLTDQATLDRVRLGLSKVANKEQLSSLETEDIPRALNKIDRIKEPTNGAVPTITSDGSLSNSSTLLTNILTKFSSATAGTVVTATSDGKLSTSTVALTTLSAKLDKIGTSVIDNVVTIKSTDGIPKDSGVSISTLTAKLNKITNPVANNLPIINADGTLSDSGKSITNVGGGGGLYYLNYESGNDSNDGLTPDTAIKTVATLFPRGIVGANLILKGSKVSTITYGDWKIYTADASSITFVYCNLYVYQTKQVNCTGCHYYGYAPTGSIFSKCTGTIHLRGNITLNDCNMTLFDNGGSYTVSGNNNKLNVISV